MNELIDILKDEIKNKEELLENRKLVSRLEEILNTIDNNISGISKQDVMSLRDLLSRIEYAKLKSLFEFISEVNMMSDGLLILSEEDNKLIQSIKEIINSKINELKSIHYDSLLNDINKLKELIIKLSNYGEELISKEDMESILNILKNTNTSKDVIQRIFLRIAYHNERIFNNYNILNRESVSESLEMPQQSFEKTNLSKEDITKLFLEFKIDVNIFSEEDLEELCAFGKLDLIKKKLDILRDNYQYHVFKNGFILSKTLLYTSVNELQILMDYNKKYSLNEVFIKYPTIYFRKVKERTSKVGSLDNFLGNIKFLEDNNFDVHRVAEKCPIFFTFPYKIVAKNYKITRLYGIDFTSDESYTFLNAPHLEDSIDLFIESGLFDYACENKSRLMQSGDIICARVKYAKKLKDLNDIHGTDYPFREYVSVDGKKKTLKKEFADRKETMYGRSLSDTYELYGSFNNIEENTDIYSKIVKGSDNVSITNTSLTNKISLMLDSLFKESDLLYNFNGVKISRLKVLRLLETFLMTPNIEVDNELLRYIISYNSMLDEEEFNIIRECINRLEINYDR